MARNTRGVSSRKLAFRRENAGWEDRAHEAMHDQRGAEQLTASSRQFARGLGSPEIDIDCEKQQMAMPGYAKLLH